MHFSVVKVVLSIPLFRGLFYVLSSIPLVLIYVIFVNFKAILYICKVAIKICKV